MAQAIANAVGFTGNTGSMARSTVTGVKNNVATREQEATEADIKSRKKKADEETDATRASANSARVTATLNAGRAAGTNYSPLAGLGGMGLGSGGGKRLLGE